MNNVSRREMLASAAGVAALGLSGPLLFMPRAEAADARTKGFYSYKVGSDIEVISIYDGVWQRKHDDNLIVGKTADDAKSALRKAGLSDAFVPIEFAFTIVKSGGKTIMIDAGTGAQLTPTAGLASKGMEGAGISVADIDTILVSHMHPDHIFGLMAKETNEQIFPNAEILVGETEYKFWTDPSIISTLPERRKPLAKRVQATFPDWKNVTLFSGEKEVAPGITAMHSFGHSPGHTTFHVSSGDDQLMIIGDAILVPALFLANLDWQLGFDADKDAATAARKSIVERAVSDKITVAGYHFGFPNSGKIEKDGNSYVFNPIAI